MYHIRITDQSNGSVVMDSMSDCIIGVVNCPESDETSSVAAIRTNGRVLRANLAALLDLSDTVLSTAINHGR